MKYKEIPIKAEATTGLNASFINFQVFKLSCFLFKKYHRRGVVNTYEATYPITSPATLLFSGKELNK